jgi:hypothetical protein
VGKGWAPKGGFGDIQHASLQMYNLFFATGEKNEYPMRNFLF